MRWSKLFIPAGFMFAAACGTEESDFASAVPKAESVTIQAPESNANALSVGTLSSYYVLTRVSTVGVNSTVRGVFSLIEDIVENPPTTIDGDTATWGPGGGDGLDPNVYQLVVSRSGQLYDYHLDFRRKSSDGAFTVLLSGHADKSNAKDDGVGTLTVHADAWGELNYSDCDRGTVEVEYDTESAPQKLTVDFKSFRSCEDEDVYSATYYYDRSADGSGNFQFTANGDIQEGARLPVVLEDLVIRSRWNASGEGRSDVRISGGDLSLEGADEVTASECWDTNYKLTFGSTTPQVADLDHQAGVESACPAGMTEESFAVDVALVP